MAVPPGNVINKSAGAYQASAVQPSAAHPPIASNGHALAIPSTVIQIAGCCTPFLPSCAAARPPSTVPEPPKINSTNP
jgi:hypothetical protein